MSRSRFLVLASVVAAGAAALVAAPSASALSANKTFPVIAKVVNSCTITVPTALDFGNYDPVVANKTTAVTTSATLSITCTKKSPGVSVGLSDGASPNGTGLGRRAMTDGTDKLGYELYSDAAMASAWTDDSATSTGSVTYGAAEFVNSTTAVNRTVFGKLFAGQTNVQVGDYSDTVQATVYF